MMIVAGLAAILICLFIAYVGYRGLRWYNEHEQGFAKNVQGKGWYIAAAIASIVGISVFTLIPFLALAMGIAALVVIADIEKGNVRSFWPRVGQWTAGGVMVGGVAAAIAVGITLFFRPSK